MRQLGEYRVYLTREHEYHVDRHVCRGVRERGSGQWLQVHWTLSQNLASAFADGNGRLFSVHTPSIGERLRFRCDGAERATSPILAIEQPARLSPALRDCMQHEANAALRETA
jgi:hypothetical protein